MRFERITLNDGKWRHIVTTRDGMNLCAYVDGALEDSSIPWPPSICTSDDPVLIGSGSKILHYLGWHGLIDDVRIYSYALSEAEVKALYEGKDPPLKKE